MIHVTMSPLNAEDLHRIFVSLDQNGDGLLSIDELNWLVESTGVQASLEEPAFLVGEAGLEFEEFCFFYESLLKKKKKKGTCVIDQNGFVKEEEEEEEDDDEDESDLYKAFKVFDLDDDGLISPKELQRVLWRLGMWDNLDCDRIMHKYDVNCDGFVDFDEFKIMMIAH